MNERALTVYKQLMVEVVDRIASIDTATRGRLPVHPKIAEEFCYLQLRMICEVIAFGCLVIHGTLMGIKPGLMTTYKASYIVKELEKLNPLFYPMALKFDPLSRDAAMPSEFWASEDDVLTQQDLCKLWAKDGGENLHRESAANILIKPPKFEEIVRWRAKIAALLGSHSLMAPDRKTMFQFFVDFETHEVTSMKMEKISDEVPAHIRPSKDRPKR